MRSDSTKAALVGGQVHNGTLFAGTPTLYCRQEVDALQASQQEYQS